VKEHSADNAADNEISVGREIALIDVLIISAPEQENNERKLHHKDQYDVGSAIGLDSSPDSLLLFILLF